MNIIAHRGYWKTRSEMNTSIAFKRALDNGFGIETDIRDYCGELVIAHDIPISKSQKFDEFLKLYNNIIKKDNLRKPWLAINIKSDGLQGEVKRVLQNNKIFNYFVFDMSVPDMLHYAKNDINFFIRNSEYEPIFGRVDGCKGVWLDQFKSMWFNCETLERHCDNYENICMVSSELHGRDHTKCWRMFRNFDYKGKNDPSRNLMICTDKPMLAKEFFSGR
jgi:hypothetical protein